ncbi:hypothetical protein ACJ72_07650, partial [Emergomyces africanus]
DKPKEPVEEINTELNTQEEISLLSKLHASREHLGKAGYVLVPPSSEEIEAAKRGAEAAQGWEQCERCNGRFQVFPGRREDGLLATGGPCTYHHAKPVRPPKKRTDHITGHKESYYPCCNETIGTSTGCTKAKWHVFKVSEVKRHLWPQGEKLLDVLVKPIGEILDLNSRYSGVRPEHFIKATPHDASSSTAITTQLDSKKPPSPSSPSSPDDKDTLQPLPVVDSPNAARDLLFQLIQPETPLIGHALENDLNACRIIHPTIVDTALLYPHPGGLPYRFSLRALTHKFLNRQIQAGGGELGHDSMEDAKATGDLVRVKIRETWKALKRVGYSFDKGKLVTPRPGKGVKDRSTGAQVQEPDTLLGGGSVLGHGAGMKKKEGE